MKTIILWAILAAMLAACTTTTSIRYETPDRHFELERTLEQGGRA